MDYSKYIILYNKTFEKAKTCLISLVDTILRENPHPYFYIGKGGLSPMSSTELNIEDPATWHSSGTSSVFGRKELGRKELGQKEETKMKKGANFAKQNMFILAAFDKDCVPEDTFETYWQQESVSEERIIEMYTLSLEAALISHYMFECPNSKLANISIKAGEY